jgi:hypothetical protein
MMVNDATDRLIGLVPTAVALGLVQKATKPLYGSSKSKGKKKRK